MKPPRRILRGDRIKTVARERPPKPDPIPPMCYHDDGGSRDKPHADALMVLAAVAMAGRRSYRSEAPK